jgi:hypothetical protein
MAEKSHPRLLEVTVIPLEPTRWEWRVYEGDTPLMTGFETSRETAQIEGGSIPLAIRVRQMTTPNAPMGGMAAVI